MDRGAWQATVHWVILELQSTANIMASQMEQW